MSQNKRWVLLENNEPHTVLLNRIQVMQAMVKYKSMYPKKRFTLFFDEYYEYIDYYSDEEKEQINRLIP